jgi:hypothetical protein
MVTWPEAGELLVPDPPVVLLVLLLLLELQAAISRPAAASATVPSRRLFTFMVLLTQIGT